MSSKTFRLGLVIFFLGVIPHSCFALIKVGLDPSKLEMEIVPGSSLTKTINITNYGDEPISISTTVGDFVPDSKGGSILEFLTTSGSPYSLKDAVAIVPQDQKFGLSPGETKTVSFAVSIPTKIAPGGRYGFISFGAESLSKSQFHFTTSLMTLLFVRIPGGVKTEGSLKEFDVQKSNDEVKGFDLVYENTGAMYVNPYGYVKITNWYNKEVGFVPIDPWFVLPFSSRFQSVPYRLALSPGWYHAELKLNRGYSNIIDSRRVSFFVWSWWFGIIPVLAVLGVGLIVLKRSWKKY